MAFHVEQVGMLPGPLPLVVTIHWHPQSEHNTLGFPLYTTLMSKRVSASSTVTGCDLPRIRQVQEPGEHLLEIAEQATASNRVQP